MDGNLEYSKMILGGASATLSELPGAWRRIDQDIATVLGSVQRSLVVVERTLPLASATRQDLESHAHAIAVATRGHSSTDPPNATQRMLQANDKVAEFAGRLALIRKDLDEARSGLLYISGHPDNIAVLTKGAREIIDRYRVSY